MITKISVESFFALPETALLIDVRSPLEFNHAHIPTAINLPLFDDEQRKIVGTTYKQESREAAIKIGLDFFGPKMKSIVEAVEQLIKERPENNNLKIYVHCARGGMRSAAVAWLLNLYGFSVTQLVGGYKAYRNWVLQQFSINYSFKILGGYTGSKKTKILHQTQQAVIDIEDLAHHKGSAFGNIAMPTQPTQEMFENKLAQELFTKSKNTDAIWLEDESQRLGFNIIPNAIWLQMRHAPVYFLEIPFTERLQNIIEEYGVLPKDKLEESIHKIAKRLGGLETKNALQYLQDDNITDCFTILLKYYDKYYQKGLEKRDNDQSKIIKITPKEAISLFK